MKFNKYKNWGAYHWTEYERDTIYSKHVDVVRNWVKGNKILDIGAGDGLITHFLAADGIDDCELAVRLAQEKGVNVNVGSAYILDGNYDTVFMGDVLEHLEFPGKCIEQINKVLEGRLYIVTPPFTGVITDKYHYKEYTIKELVEFIESFGFELVEKPFIDNKRIYAVFTNKKSVIASN